MNFMREKSGVHCSETLRSTGKMNRVEKTVSIPKIHFLSDYTCILQDNSQISCYKHEVKVCIVGNADAYRLRTAMLIAYIAFPGPRGPIKKCKET